MAFSELRENQIKIESLEKKVSTLESELKSLRKCFRDFSVGVTHLGAAAKKSFQDMEKVLLTNEKK